jgi:MerR family transcriptional regulator, copper efflux regulator
VSDLDELFSIGELVRRTGLNQRTIHFYESLGLIVPAERKGRGYRYYDAQSEQRLCKIVQLKRVGLSLEEIRDVIDLYFSPGGVAAGRRRIVALLKGHLRETEQKLTELQQFRTELQANIAHLEQVFEADLAPT